MKVKRICAAVISLAMTAGSMSFFPSSDQITHADCEFVSNDFEVSYEGWTNFGDLTSLEVADGIGCENSRGMLVSGRQSASDGAYSQKGFYIDGGIQYHYSVFVYQDSMESDNFRFSLSYSDDDGLTRKTVELASKEVKCGKWTEIYADYAAPENAVDLTVSLSTDSTCDFRFDNVKITGRNKAGYNSVGAAENDYGLKDRFAGNFRVGNILNSGTIKNSTITANILKNYNSITCENEMKPDSTLSKATSSNNNIGVSLSGAASILDFCAKNNIGVRGHTLVWHSQTPQWYFKDNLNDNGSWVSKDVMNQRMESYIKNLFSAIKTQYPDLDLYAYDVCNECVSDDSSRTKNNGGARLPGYGDGKSPWVQIYGNNSFVEQAFTYANKYAPSTCSLFYNDYNEYWDHKRDCIAAMCESLYKKGLLDGVGMQSHVNADSSGFSGIGSHTTALKKYAAIGCQVQITELDMSTEGGKFSLDQQASKYKAIFQAALDVNKGSAGKVTAICIWGPNDSNTWIKTENAPLLFDKSNNPKPAYDAISSLASGSGTVTTTTQPLPPVEPDPNGYYFHSTFESGTDDWTYRGPSTVEQNTSVYYQGKGCISISDRTDPWNGASIALDPKAFKAGNTYAFSTMVMQNSSSSEEILMKLQYVDAEDETCYSPVASADVKKGTWTQLLNSSYTIPDGATDIQLYVETPENLIDFYVDEAIGAQEGKIKAVSPSGPSETPTIMYGDITGDKMVDITDLTYLSLYLLDSQDFDDEQVKKADVTGDGNVDLADLAHLKQYIMKDNVKLGPQTSAPIPSETIKPTETTKPDIDITKPDTAKMDSLFAGLKIAQTYKTNNNPLMSQKFGADPGVMEYNGRVYVYMTNDAFEYKNGAIAENSYNVQTINCLSSDDLINWTDHGSIPVSGQNGAAKWAGFSWAPCAAHKTINGKEQFFLYFANNANGIGVLTSDSPTGPWKDPIGKPLISRSTPNCNDVTWLFDPGVLVDDDGTGYLYFGGGVPTGQNANPKTARAVKLGADMTSLAGTPVMIDAPYMFEDSGINKIGNKYYYSYCTNWDTGGNQYGLNNGTIAYMTSDSPLGPFKFESQFFANPGTFGSDFGSVGNNHHCIVNFNDQLYMFYHSRGLEKAMGVQLNYRSSHVDKLTVSNGKIQNLKGTMSGVPQLKSVDPYKTNQAEAISDQGGINVSGLGNTVISKVDSGDWIKVSGVDFSKGASTITVRVSSVNGAAIKVCTTGTSNKAAGYIEIPKTNGITEITAPVSGITGKQDIYFIFSGQLEFDSWSFK